MSGTPVERSAVARAGSSDPVVASNNVDHGAASHTGHRARLAASLARLSNIVAARDLDDTQLVFAHESVEQLAHHLAGTSTLRRPWWLADDPSRAYWRQSPFVGDENPHSVGLRLERVTGECPRVIGRVTVGPSFGGPPRAVHGGVLSGLFDEVLGTLAGLVAPERVIVTARLTVRYRHLTPLGEPLTITADVQRATSRRIVVTGDCVASDVVTASAEALMVAR